MPRQLALIALELAAGAASLRLAFEVRA